MNAKITTALFDLDGVLIDSEVLVTSAFRHVIESFGISGVRDERTTALSGATLREIYESIAPAIDVQRMIDAHVDFQFNNMNLVTACDGAVKTLLELQCKGVRTGVITNRSRNAKSTIAHCGMGGLIGVIVAVEDVNQPKPHPEGVLKAMKHFSAGPAETIMVGDMPADVEAGSRAGTITVGMDTSSQREALRKSRPDYFIHSLPELVPLFFMD